MKAFYFPYIYRPGTWGGNPPAEYQSPNTWAFEKTGEVPGMIYIFEDVFGFDYFTKSSGKNEQGLAYRTTWIKPHGKTWAEWGGRNSIGALVEYAREWSKDDISETQPLRFSGNIGAHYLRNLKTFVPIPKLEDIKNDGKFVHDVLTIARLTGSHPRGRLILSEIEKQNGLPPQDDQLPTDQAELIRYVLEVAQRQGPEAAAQLAARADNPLSLAYKMLKQAEIEGFVKTYETFADKSPYFRHPLVPYCRQEDVDLLVGMVPNQDESSPELIQPGLYFLGTCRHPISDMSSSYEARSFGSEEESPAKRQKQ